MQGQLDETWSDMLGGLAISTVEWYRGVRVTELVGEVKDQSALAGVLAALSELGLPLLSVEFVEASTGG